MSDSTVQGSAARRLPPNPGLYSAPKPKYAGDGPSAREGHCRRPEGHNLQPRRIGLLRRRRLVCTVCLYAAPC